MTQIKIKEEKILSDGKIIRIELEMPTATEEEEEKALLEESYRPIVKKLSRYFAATHLLGSVGSTVSLTLLEIHLKKISKTMLLVIKDEKMKKKIEEEILLSPVMLTCEQMEEKVSQIVEGRYKIKVD